MPSLKDLREQRSKLIADARAINDKADTEKRGLSADEVESQRKMLDDAKNLVAQIRNAEELEEEEAALRASLPESQRTEKREQKPEAGERGKKYNEALRSYLRNGFNMMTGEEQMALRTGYRDFSAEERSQSTLSGAAGGYDVAPDTSFYGRIQEARKFYGGMFNAGCTVLNTATGADLPIPTVDDTGNVGAIVAEEGSHASGTDVSLAQVTLHSYLYSSKIVKVSWQLLQDAETDWEGFLARIFGMRLGRIQNTHLTTGSGSSQPYGVVTQATLGRQSATGNTSSVTWDDVKRLIHSVDVAYRASGKIMTNDATALAYRLLKDGNGRDLWQDSVNAGQPATMLGYPVVINNDVATMTTSAKHTLFGDFSNYYIRQVRGIQVVRLNELYAANGQVGFMAFMRFDGALVDAGQHPIKYLQNSAS
jgi:HK97 family phage major capsid protein